MEMREVAFSGRITAAFTHEMKNVLAIIKETAGLMEDMLLMSREAPFPHRERFSRAIALIGEQIDRGVELSNRLNRFAHSSDEPVAVIDLNDLAGRFAGLVHRFARLRNVSLDAGCRDENNDLTVTASPIALQMGLFAALECCWDHLPAGSKIVLLPARKEEGAAMGVICRGDLGERDDFVRKVSGSEDWEGLNRMIGNLRGKIEWDAAEFGFYLIFPSDR